MKPIEIGIVLLCGVAMAANWARVENGEVRETFKSEPKFHPDVMRTIEACPDNVEPGWRKVGDALLPPLSGVDLARAEFDKLRVQLLSISSSKARSIMRARFTHRLDGPLASGYPNLAQPLCTNALGEALCLNDFLEYVQERVDADASSQEIKALNDAAKAARIYLRSLK